MKMIVKRFIVLILCLVSLLFNSALLETNGHAGGSMNTYSHRRIAKEKLYGPAKIIQVPKININTASFEELMTLPYMEESFAYRILKVRPLKSMDDLYELSNMPYDKTQGIIDAFMILIEF